MYKYLWGFCTYLIELISYVFFKITKVLGFFSVTLFVLFFRQELSDILKIFYKLIMFW